VVTKVEEELLVVDHLGFTVKEHSGGLSKVLASIKPLAHAVVVKSFASVLETVNTIDNE
jgi:hypothetical protein